jgi:hypothetical protein
LPQRHGVPVIGAAREQQRVWSTDDADRAWVCLSLSFLYYPCTQQADCRLVLFSVLRHEEIKRRLNSGNACYHSVQKLLSSRLLSKNVKIRIYRTTILPVVLYGFETSSLTLREEHRLRVDSKGFWRWRITLGITGFLDFVYRMVF